LTNSDREVAIIGGGAAGIAAGRRLAEARIDCLIVEARPRLGGRAWTTGDGAALGSRCACSCRENELPFNGSLSAVEPVCLWVGRILIHHG
jgi:cation diffusion facilitator CzcD-associated flavoprotein CzcO